jgi:hypothetical protein
MLGVVKRGGAFGSRAATAPTSGRREETFVGRADAVALSQERMATDAVCEGRDRHQ